MEKRLHDYWDVPDKRILERKNIDSAKLKNYLAGLPDLADQAEWVKTGDDDQEEARD